MEGIRALKSAGPEFPSSLPYLPAGYPWTCYLTSLDLFGVIKYLTELETTVPGQSSARYRIDPHKIAVAFDG
jgi:hypothetical protein